MESLQTEAYRSSEAGKGVLVQQRPQLLVLQEEEVRQGEERASYLQEAPFLDLQQDLQKQKKKVDRTIITERKKIL